MAGLDACIKFGADVIVNTDTDNQYNSANIPLLIEPIFDKRVEIVVGTRPVREMEHFSPVVGDMGLLLHEASGGLVVLPDNIVAPSEGLYKMGNRGGHSFFYGSGYNCQEIRLGQNSLMLVRYEL